MPAAKTSMALRNRQKKRSDPSSSNSKPLEVMEEAAAPRRHPNLHPHRTQLLQLTDVEALKRQRKPSEKVIASSDVQPPKATARKRAATSSSKVARTTSSLTTLTSENTEELITPTLADLSSSQTPIPHSTDRSRSARSSKQTAVRSSQSQQNLPQGSKSLKRKREVTDNSDQQLATLLQQLEEREKALKAKELALEEQVAASGRRDEESKSLFAIAQGQRASELYKTLEDVHSCSL
jgi:hypothetical protein